MKKELHNKILLRRQYLSLRKTIPLQRKKAIAPLLPFYMSKILEKHSSICSFVSTKYEINTSILNTHILKKKKLILLKISNNELIPYQIDDLKTQLIKNPTFNIFEPNPIKCKKIKIDALKCILIPGTVFDKNKNRLGYGKGFYDKLLSKTNNACLIGLGYNIQLYDKILPFENHDIPLHKICLF